MSSPHEPRLIEVRMLARELCQDTRDVLERVREARNGLLRIRGSRQSVEEQNPGPLVAFVHIPKTAGGTVSSMFVGAYTRAGLRDAGNYLRRSGKALNKVSKRAGTWEAWRGTGGRVTVGHVPLGHFRQHLPADTRYMTFLREPVERVLSHYYRHIQRTGTDVDNKKPVSADSLEEALVERKLPDVSNLATRFLCGDPTPFGELSTDALDQAKANLRAFTFVGIQERFWESVVLLQRTLDVDLSPSVDRHVSIDRPVTGEIPDEQREMIADHNRLDAELYAFGRSLFDEAVAAAHDETFTDEVETLRGLSAAKNEAEVQKATDWLERHLPAGARRPQDAVRSAAVAAGIEPAALRHASRLLAVAKERDDHGDWIWARSEAPG